MIIFRLTIVLLLFLLTCRSVHSQEFSDIQQYHIPILLNPSYVGATKGDRLIISPVSTRRIDTKSYLRYLSHDFFYKKRSLGLGFIGGAQMDYTQNIFVPFFEIAAAKYLPKGHDTFLIPSVTIGFHQPLKEYGLFHLDNLIDTREHTAYAPGTSLYRSSEFIAGGGILLADYNGSVGLSAKYRRSFFKNPYEDKFDVEAYDLIIHAEKIFTYKHRDLLSKAYMIRPRLVIHVGNETKQLFTGVTVQRKKFEMGIGFLPNFDSGNTRFSINTGIDLEYFKVNYLASVLNDTGEFRAFMHSISLRIIFPELKRYGIPIPGIIRNL
ncbi:hypothetical protein [uncultured Sunxiuqinia sp.]|uniref:hypothetical protein n=1 Tax=uncultured Sunxiuqinia sp. TaxID=1573825 RepID=UPI002AA73AF7|nr:hypothetical protein [uncultured Sunxiuqinia sp.]